MQITGFSPASNRRMELYRIELHLTLQPNESRWHAQFMPAAFALFLRICCFSLWGCLTASHAFRRTQPAAGLPLLQLSLFPADGGHPVQIPVPDLVIQCDQVGQ